MNHESVVDKIRKLLALAKSPNPNEAAAAAARAAALMTKYHLDRAVVDVDETERAIKEESIDASKKAIRWRQYLAGGVAYLYGCRAYSAFEGDKILTMVVGREEDIAAVRYSFQYLCREVDRLTEEAWKNSWTFESPRRWKNAFRVGAASTIQHRLYKARDESLSDIRDDVSCHSDAEALARVERDERAVEDYLSKLGLQSSRAPTVSSFDGAMEGRRAGQGVDIGGNKTGLQTPRDRLSDVPRLESGS